ncbi:hypothetical protein EVAR_100428_1 [Eumeta japonica]|uniref:Uncharacterized protein n=1 Tax=Eumeta variegata TaxID=151549 RepID=A0A4C2A3S8_EUMVA|nr:hypothetical protein EVAR_100428_1 [Eumeta japonica]
MRSICCMWPNESRHVMLSESRLRSRPGGGCAGARAGRSSRVYQSSIRRPRTCVPYHRSDATISLARLFCWLEAFTFLEHCCGEKKSIA